MDHPSQPSNTNETINCPHCGAVASYQRGAASTLCPYCGQSIAVPVIPVLRATRQNLTSAGEHKSQTVYKSPAQPASPASNLGCVVALVAGIVLFVGAIIGINVWTAAPKATPTPYPTQRELPTAAPAATDVPAPTVAPTASLYDISFKFGSKGTGPGKFDNPYHLGLDAKGNIYVSEYMGGRVQVFDSQGTFITQWFMDNPEALLYGFAVDPDGVVYEAAEHDLERYDGATGKKFEALPYPTPGFEAVALMPDGGVVAMWNSFFSTGSGASERLVGFDKNGKQTFELVEPVTSQTGENDQVYILLATNRQGEIYVLSQRSGVIFKYSSAGKLITRFGSPGPNPGQLQGTLSGLAIDQRGQVYVSDDNGLVVFSGDGGYLRTIPTTRGLDALIFDSHNELWAIQGDEVVRMTIN